MTTVLDAAYAGMIAGGDAEGMAFYRALADAELFVLLEAEAQGAVMTPRVFDLDEGPVLLAFDSEERLAVFADGPLPYAALPGRVVAGQMAGAAGRLSLGLNLGTGAVCEVILPPQALDWLLAMLDQAPPEAVAAQVVRFEAPVVPQAVLAALAGVVGCVQGARAHLVGALYQDGRRGVLLAISGAAAEAEASLARAVTEALAFSGVEAAALDVVFVAEGAAVLARMAGLAMVLDGVAAVEERPVRQAPGTNPDRPPYLR